MNCRTRIKICCIATIDEARLAIQYGASAIGLVSHMPSGPGVIPEKIITRIANQVPPPIGTFLLTSETDTRRIIEQQKRCRTNTLQLCDRLMIGTHQDLRDELPGVKIVQVIHVQDVGSIDEAGSAAKTADALLLDSGKPSGAVKVLGGTGKVHNWELSKQIVESVDIPVFLAGGLNASNVTTAIHQVNPFGVDICSGVRTDGKLDKEKLRAFAEAVG